MKFYGREVSNKMYPCFTFQKDNWDDFGFKITFDLFFEDSSKESYRIGSTKILNATSKNTTLPDSFTFLDNTFYSLATELEFYENLKLKFTFNEVVEVLEALNDIAFNPNMIDGEIEELEGYSSALLRFTSSNLLLKSVRTYIIDNRLAIDELSTFKYSFKLQDANGEHSVNFDYQKLDIPFSSSVFPYRINAIIGKNGTGKTQFLSSLVKALAGIENENGFSPTIPQFNKVIAISYSIFDDFPKPEENNKFSYNYIGYRHSDEVILTNEELNNKLKNALIKIIERKKSSFFYLIMNKILDLRLFGILDPQDLDTNWIDDFNFNSTKRLSSGQSILFFIITELIAEIQPHTFVLFDEPETHLHPAATSLLVDILYTILEENNSFALLSTHSPLLLQNIPSRYVHVFDRIGNTPKINRLNMETFGANISEISDQVFETVNVEEYYKKILDQMPPFNREDLVKELFKSDLSFNAKLYLQTSSK